MLNIIKNLLLLKINDIDSGNSNISELDLIKIINTLKDISKQLLCKTEACDYIGVSRATFDNYVTKGLIPQGEKRRGISAKFWNKSDLDKYLLQK